jgi:hypothetical protein
MTKEEIKTEYLKILNQDIITDKDIVRGRVLVHYWNNQI